MVYNKHGLGIYFYTTRTPYYILYSYTVTQQFTTKENINRLFVLPMELQVIYYSSYFWLPIYHNRASASSSPPMSRHRLCNANMLHHSNLPRLQVSVTRELISSCVDSTMSPRITLNSLKIIPIMWSENIGESGVNIATRFGCLATKYYRSDNLLYTLLG